MSPLSSTVDSRVIMALRSLTCVHYLWQFECYLLCCCDQVHNLCRLKRWFFKFFYYRKCLRADVFNLCTVSTGLSYSLGGLKSSRANLNSDGITTPFAVVPLWRSDLIVHQCKYLRPFNCADLLKVLFHLYRCTAKNMETLEGLVTLKISWLVESDGFFVGWASFSNVVPLKLSEFRHSDR